MDMFENKGRFSEHISIRWCIGDFLWNEDKERKAYIKASISPCTVEVDDATLKSLEDPNDKSKWITVYRAKAVVMQERNLPQNPNIITPWYMTHQDVDDHLKRMGFEYQDIQYDTGHLFHRRTYPVAFPKKVMLKRNEKGCYARIEMHPEQTGKEDANGKFFFPDTSSRKNLCVGPAIVHRVFERADTYGFMKVEMEQFSAPSDVAVVRYMKKMIGNTCDCLREKYVSWEHSLFGSHVRIYDPVLNAATFLRLDPDTGEAVEDLILEEALTTWNTPEETHFGRDLMMHSIDVICATKFDVTRMHLRENISKNLILPNQEHMHQKSKPWDLGVDYDYLRMILANTKCIVPCRIPTKFNSHIPFLYIDLEKLDELILAIPDKAEMIRLLVDVKDINFKARWEMRRCGFITDDTTEGDNA